MWLWWVEKKQWHIKEITSDFNKTSVLYTLCGLTWLTCLGGLSWSPSLRFSSGVAVSERPFGWVAADSVRCVIDRDMTLPWAAPETPASDRGCGGSGSSFVDWKEPWRPLDCNLESAVHLGPVLSQRVPCWGPPQNTKSSSVGLGWNGLLNCRCSLSCPPRLHSEDPQNSWEGSGGSSLNEGEGIWLVMLQTDGSTIVCVN